MAKEATVMEPSVLFREIDCHHTGKRPCAEPDEQILHRKTHEQARWSSSEGRWFEVDFGSRSPFAESKFELKVAETVESGPITGKPGTYKYSLVNDLGEITDPTIIIQE